MIVSKQNIFKRIFFFLCISTPIFVSSNSVDLNRFSKNKFKSCCESIPGPTGPVGETGPQGLQGNQGATGVTGATGAVGDRGSMFLFSSSIETVTAASLGASGLFTGYSEATPYFDDSSVFDAGPGFFTVPSDGKYSIKITVFYRGWVPSPQEILDTVRPKIVLRCVSDDPDTDLLVGNIGTIEFIDNGGDDPRTVVYSDTITLVGDLNLSSGDVLALYFDGDGIDTTGAVFGDTDYPGVVWSVHRI